MKPVLSPRAQEISAAIGRASMKGVTEKLSDDAFSALGSLCEELAAEVGCNIPAFYREEKRRREKFKKLH